MIVWTSVELVDENGLRTLVLKTENPVEPKSIDGNEHPLDWTGFKRIALEHVQVKRAAGERIDRVRVIGLRDSGYSEEFDV